MKTDSTVTVPHQEVQAFKPDANKSMLFSAVFPGLGQIYNRKYWKLPLVYGSFLGCTYAILWNQTQFTGYRQAYRDFIDDDINTVSWKNYISPALGYSDNTSEWKDSDVSWFQNTLKRKRDYYNHYRDMSILVSIGIYAVWIVDAYVDAQLFDFDIGPDLSMKIEPAIFEKTNISSRMFGLQLSMIF
ncbi:MAG: DUF5683 domain-containing protein [Dysgonamonadaceae bacterium]|nr:DUF5683 domain-containing protein [Dysgonamonadaceae bacterium]